MRRLLLLAVAGALALSSTVANAESGDGDRILGEYKAVKDGAVTKVRISKIGENRYTAQVVGFENENNSCIDRAISAKQLVLIESVSYNSKEGVWDDGEIFDPTKGEIYRVVLDFESDTTLRVRGYLGPFYRSIYWEKVN
ncbi:MAG: DUF2147 domain-containing protein [Alistipes sp.]|nr:DUF2147 domain-containing protein [Alistipes sp.]